MIHGMVVMRILDQNCCQRSLCGFNQIVIFQTFSWCLRNKYEMPTGKLQSSNWKRFCFLEEIVQLFHFTTLRSPENSPLNVFNRNLLVIAIWGHPVKRGLVVMPRTTGTIRIIHTKKAFPHSACAFPHGYECICVGTLKKNVRDTDAYP